MMKYRKPKLSPKELVRLQDIMDMFRGAPDYQEPGFDYSNDTSVECFKSQVYFYSLRKY